MSACEPVDTKFFEMSHREKRRLRIDDLPRDLNEACDELEKNDVNLKSLIAEGWSSLTQATLWECVLISALQY